MVCCVARSCGGDVAMPGVLRGTNGAALILVERDEPPGTVVA